MKNIAYRIINAIGFVLSIPLALAWAACIILGVVHKVTYTFVKLTFGKDDPYAPMRDLAELGRGIADTYEKLYNDCSKYPSF